MISKWACHSYPATPPFKNKLVALANMYLSPKTIFSVKTLGRRSRPQRLVACFTSSAEGMRSPRLVVPIELISDTL